jgi:hypothetical protein
LASVKAFWTFGEAQFGSPDILDFNYKTGEIKFFFSVMQSIIL